MSALGNFIGLAWTLAAWWFIASVFAAPVIVAIRKARARGKRKFATEPTRIRACHPDTRIDHRWDS